jgi:hypothetical protein
MKMPAVQLKDRRSPHRLTGAGGGGRRASASINPAVRDLAGARIVHGDTFTTYSSANDPRAVAAFPLLAANEDAGAETALASRVWSGRTRLGLIIGLPMALWFGIFALVRFVA